MKKSLMITEAEVDKIWHKYYCFCEGYKKMKNVMGDEVDCYRGNAAIFKNIVTKVCKTCGHKHETETNDSIADFMNRLLEEREK